MATTSLDMPHRPTERESRYTLWFGEVRVRSARFLAERVAAVG